MLEFIVLIGGILLASLFWAGTKWGRNLAQSFGKKKKKLREDDIQEDNPPRRGREPVEAFDSESSSITVMPLVLRWLRRKAKASGVTVDEVANTQLMKSMVKKK